MGNRCGPIDNAKIIISSVTVQKDQQPERQNKDMMPFRPILHCLVDIEGNLNYVWIMRNHCIWSDVCSSNCELKQLYRRLDDSERQDAFVISDPKIVKTFQLKVCSKFGLRFGFDPLKILCISFLILNTCPSYISVFQLHLNFSYFTDYDEFSDHGSIPNRNTLKGIFEVSDFKTL